MIKTNKTIALTTSTALLAHENTSYYVTCSLNLSGLGHVAITASGTPVEGTFIAFVCNFNTTNYTENTDDVTFYGFTVPAELAAKTFYAFASYNAGAWRVIFTPSLQNTALIDTGLIKDSAVTTAKITDANVTTVKIADANVTTTKIADSNVTLAKIQDIADDTVLGNVSGGAAEPTALTLTELRTLLDQDIVLTGDVSGTATQDPATGVTTITVSYGACSIAVADLSNNLKTDWLSASISAESGALTAGQGYVGVKVPWACTVEEWMVSVTELIEATNDVTLTLYDHSGNLMTGSTITVTAGTKPATSAPPSGSVFNSSAITANNALTAGQLIGIRVQKTTAGGRMTASIKIKKT